jgi:hypothetical protein
MRAAWMIVMVAVVACSSNKDDDDAPPPAPLRVDDCANGELPQIGGGCVKVGVRECGEGFTFDVDRGCNPILPAMRCGAGMMAIPGDSACRPIAECGDGKWGAIPVAAGTVYVDASYAGTDSDGTADRPFTKIQAGVDVAARDGVVAIAEGNYLESVIINRPLRLWGRCPQKVSIAGNSTFTIDIVVDAEVHNVAVTGPDTAIGTARSSVLLDHVHVRNAVDRGVDVEDVGGVTSLILRDSLIEGSGQIGLYAEGSAITIERSSIRSTRGRKPGVATNGILARAGEVSKAPSSLRVVRSFIDDNTTFGVNVADSSAVFDGCVVRGTHATDTNPAAAGITVQKIEESSSPDITITRSLIDAHEGVGLDLSKTTATIDSVTIRDIVGVAPGGLSLENATAKVTASTIVDVQGLGVFVTSSKAELTGLHVLRTLPDRENRGGAGVMVDSDHGYASETTITNTLIAKSHAMGFGAFGSRVTLTDVAVLGVGVDSNGLFGDAIGLSTSETDGRVDVVDATITRVVVRGSARAALSVFGGNAHVAQSSFCSPLDINVERVFAVGSDTGARYEHEVFIEDLGGNVCGCGVPATCRAGSAGMTPLRR